MPLNELLTEILKLDRKCSVFAEGPAGSMALTCVAPSIALLELLHSILMFAELMIGVHLATSPFTSLASDCGPRLVLSGMSLPNSSKRFRVVASSSVLSSARASLSMIGFGVVLGANRAVQPDTEFRKAGFLGCRHVR